MQIQKLDEYCKVMLLDYEIEGSIIFVNDNSYQIVEDINMTIFDSDMKFQPEHFIELEDDSIGYAYEFGGRWYLQEDGEEVSMQELKYIGKVQDKLPTKSFLGIRSGYELMNGMGLYADWIEKAKFLGITSLGICEKNTLGGVLLFQNECRQNGIKPIIGMTLPIKGNETYDIKVYVKDFQGWLSLLKFNEKINVDKDHHIDEKFFVENSENLYKIADPKSLNFKTASDLIKSSVDYYQLDTVNFITEEKDVEYLNNLERWILSGISPISITDAFYLEKADWKTREVMWAVAKSFDDKTNNQYFKSKTQYAGELVNLFEKGNKSWIELYRLSLEAEEELVENCNFKYDTDTRHLPKYIMTDEEAEEHESNDALFLHLIKKGFRDRGIKHPAKYIDRLKIEINVLRTGDVIDYFLGLHDIIRYAQSKDMLTGIGRGSAGGSLVAYLLGIIQIDPLEFDLIFERFLNSGRMGRWEDRPSFKYEDEEGNVIELAEGELARVIRNEKEKIVYCHEIIEGDEIIKY
tara:strand:+ start:5708 stop:7270 length:1563 start_codon:yes stop_codon:yes gene_type:complete